MYSIAERLYALTPVGATAELPAAGTALENPFAYDASARELERMAERGLAEIVTERLARIGDQPLTVHIAFKRLR